MKKKMIAAAILACGAGGVFAQSSVTIYGIVDAAYVRESGGVAGTANKITSGAASASRIGFRGTEDLGNGVSARRSRRSATRFRPGMPADPKTCSRTSARMSAQATR